MSSLRRNIAAAGLAPCWKSAWSFCVSVCLWNLNGYGLYNQAPVERFLGRNFHKLWDPLVRLYGDYCAIPPISRMRLCAFRSLVFQARAEPEKLVGTRGFPAKIIHPLPSTQSRRIPWVSILSRCLDQFRYTVMSTISAQSVICIQPVTLTKRTLRLPVQERPLALGAMRAFGTDC